LHERHICQSASPVERLIGHSVRVPDLKPPRLTGGERQTLHALLQYQRESLVRKVSDLDDTSARQPLVGSGTSLLWLTKHMARAEQMWILQRFAGRSTALTDDTALPGDTLATAIETYTQTWSSVDEVVAAANLDALCQDVGHESPVNLRWVLTHLLEETARHAGHADILRELIDGRTGR
jgi:uncharacterized damage-inducible protein DinB